MKIAASTARKYIKSGRATVVGACSTESWPNGTQYWVLNDHVACRTLHVAVDDAPKLGDQSMLA